MSLGNSNPEMMLGYPVVISKAYFPSCAKAPAAEMMVAATNVKVRFIVKFESRVLHDLSVFV